MPDIRKRLGDAGEAAAAAYLERQGYEVLARQWRCVSGEIDLIARVADLLVFVEVRTRRDSHPGVAAESITAKKQTRLIALAQAFLSESDLPADTPWRIDVVAVAAAPGGRIVSIDHIPYAVEETS